MKNMSLKTKLLVLFSAVGVIPFATAAFIGLWQTKKSAAISAEAEPFCAGRTGLVQAL